MSPLVRVKYDPAYHLICKREKSGIGSNFGGTASSPKVGGEGGTHPLPPPPVPAPMYLTPLSRLMLQVWACDL